ncbi:MAG: class A beta-lactamase [Acidobacteria bacterium]|nr:class A beta-lactamase [Acidobacteriota bacterium]
MKKALFIFVAFALMLGCGGTQETSENAGNTSSNISPSKPETGPTPDAVLGRHIREAAEKGKGRIGVHAAIVETGQVVGIRQNERFAMQSVVKVPIAMAVLKMVDDGKLKLDDKIKIEKSELVPDSMHSPIKDKNPEGTEMTVDELIKAAVSVSDGTAADVLQRVAGNAAGVQKYIDDLGIVEMEVKYTHKEFSDNSERQAANWASPEAVSALLNILFDAASGRSGGENAPSADISRQSAELLIKYMTETENPAARIKAGVPEGTVVAHKTGSSGTRNGITAATNDAAIITLPNGNHLILTVLLADSPDDQDTRNATIAAVTKAIWNKWTTTE